MKLIKRKFLILFIALSSFTIVFLFAVIRSLFAEINSPQSPPLTQESIKAGEAVFFEYCSGCHGRRADGRGPQALNLKPKPQNLRNPQFVKYLTDERMYSSVSGGVRGTSMPPYELTLTSDRRWNVIHYIRSLTSDDTINLPNSTSHQQVSNEVKNPIPLDETSTMTGKKLYANYCANCHGANADGNGIIAPNLIPEPRNLAAIASWGGKPFIDYINDARLFDSITNGVPGTSMLPWIGVMTDEERWHIINYLRSLATLEREKSK